MFSNKYLKLIRPYQWIKNLLLFSPIFFSGKISAEAINSTFWAVIVFCLSSGTGYVVNDWMDRKSDCFHPQKKFRPFATKSISGIQAFIFAVFLLVLTGIILFTSDFSASFVIYTVIYLCLTLSYSFYLKSIVILEIFIVAIGFDIRVLAGGAVSGIKISSWLFLTVFFIALMISIAKRLTEHKELGGKIAVLHRKSQAGYSLNYLNSMLWSSGGVTLVVYALYAVEHGPLVVFSIIPAAYGIFRFIYLTDMGKGSDPIKALFSDFQLLLTTLVFFIFLTVVIYK